jgi:hypothetical protein
MSFWGTEEFRKLQKEWYDKLAKEGFQDVELHDKSLHTDTAKFVDMEAIRDYYMQVSEYLYTGEFASLQDKAVWFVYSEGYSVRNIARALKLSRKKVTETVEKYIEKMNNGK